MVATFDQTRTQEDSPTMTHHVRIRSKSSVKSRCGRSLLQTKATRLDTVRTTKIASRAVLTSAAGCDIGGIIVGPGHRGNHVSEWLIPFCQFVCAIQSYSLEDRAEWPHLPSLPKLRSDAGQRAEFPSPRASCDRHDVSRSWQHRPCIVHGFRPGALQTAS